MPQLSYSERDRMIRNIIGEWVFIVDLYDDSVVIEPYNENWQYDGHTLEAGKLYRLKYTIDDNGTANLSGKPEEVARQVKYQKVRFNTVFAKAEEDQEWVYRDGKVWELAFYNDKIAVTEEQLDRAIQNFQPVSINLEHESTPLDGKLGLWERVWRVGNEVMGRLRIPRWLDELFKGEPIRCSVEFTDDRRFCGIALCNYPRVADAAIFAAFKAQETGLRHKKTEPANNGGKMNWFTKLIEWHKTGQWPQDATDQLNSAGFNPEDAAKQFAADPNAQPTQPPAGETPEQKAQREAMEAQNAQFRQQFAATEAVNLQAAAKTFAGSYIEKKKMYPAERPTIEQLFINAVRADAVSAKSTCFTSDGKPVEGDQVKLLAKMLDDRPEIFFTAHAIDGDPNQNPTGQMTAERKAHLLGLGQFTVKPS